MAAERIVLLFGEIYRGKISLPTKQLTRKSRELADQQGALAVEVLLLGDFLEEPPEELFSWGADRVLLVEHPSCAQFDQHRALKVLLTLVRERKPEMLLAPGTLRGNAVLSGLGTLEKRAVAPNALSLSLEEKTGLLRQTLADPSGGEPLLRTAPAQMPQIATMDPSSPDLKAQKPLSSPGEKGEVLRPPLPRSCFESAMIPRGVASEPKDWDNMREKTVFPEKAPSGGAPSRASRLSPENLKELETLVGRDHLLTRKSLIREGFSSGLEALVFPSSPEETGEVLRYASSRGIPVFPLGGNTRKKEHLRGLGLSLRRMNRILSLEEERRVLTAEAGTSLEEIAGAAAKKGLFYPGDPRRGGKGTLGAHAAEDDLGPNTLRYGLPRSHLLGLEAVLPSGKVTRFSREEERGGGFDLCSLLGGSRGILGIITKISLELLPLSPKRMDLLVPFRSSREALEAVPSLCALEAIPPGGLEFFNGPVRELLEARGTFHFPEPRGKASLLIQLEGEDETTLWERTLRFGKLCIRQGALEVFLASSRQDQERLERARRAIPPVLEAEYPGELFREIRLSPETLGEWAEKMEELEHHQGEPKLGALLFGSPGLGILRGGLTSPGKAAPPSGEKLLEELTRAQGGAFLREEPWEDPFHLELLGNIKRAFDPSGILSPGKVLPEQILSPEIPEEPEHAGGKCALELLETEHPQPGKPELP